MQRPFYPEPDGTCHLYLLHPPGGVVQGDRLAFDLTLAPAARVLCTTPGASRFYRCADGDGSQRQTLIVAAGAVLEWLPQETLVYSGAQARSTTRVELDAGAQCLAWDILAFGRPASAEPFNRGAYDGAFEVWRDGRPLWLDRLRVAGGSELLQAPWGLQGYAVCATLIATLRDGPQARALLHALRAELSVAADQGRLGLTMVDGLLCLRVLAAGTEIARKLLARCWDRWREASLGKRAVPPRIWQT